MTISHDPSQRSARSSRRTLYTLGALAGVAVAVFAMSLPAGFASWAVLAALALAFACSAAWFAASDEVAQRAHYEAWFRGGALFLIAAALFGLHGLITGAHWPFVQDLLHHIGGDADPSVAFSFGLVAAFVAAVIGYGLWWGLFWLRKR